MKIYRVRPKENGVSCLYSDKNKLDCLEFQHHYQPYMNDDKCFGDWDISLFYTNSSINRRKKVYNILHYNLLFFITDEQSKVTLEKKFSDCIQFLEVINDDAPSTKYYFFNPFKSVDGLDIDRSRCRFLPDSRVPIAVFDYVFKNDVEYYPVFKLRNEGIVYDKSVYATDEFKDFIEASGITGLFFEELYDFND